MTSAENETARLNTNIASTSFTSKASTVLEFDACEI